MRKALAALAAAAAIAGSAVVATPAHAENNTLCRDWTPYGLYPLHVQLRPCITLMYSGVGYYMSGQGYALSPDTDIHVYIEVGFYNSDGKWVGIYGGTADKVIYLGGSVGTDPDWYTGPICWYTREWFYESGRPEGGYAESPRNCFP
jgi:hypothetical protein